MEPRQKNNRTKPWKWEVDKEGFPAETSQGRSIGTGKHGGNAGENVCMSVWFPHLKQREVSRDEPKA